METEDDGVSKTDKELEITEKSELLYVDRRLPFDHKSPRDASKVRKLTVMLSCVMQLFICNGIGYGLSVMYAELVVVFDAKRADAALVQSLNMGLSAGAGILFAGIIKKYGPGGSIVVASVISSIGLFASSFAHGVGAIVLFTGVVTGLAMCVSYLASFVAISLLFYKDPTLFLISMTSGTSLGQFIVPLLFEIFISRYSWSGAFILLSANVEAWFIVDHAVSIGLTRESGSLMVSAIGLGNLIGRMIGSTIRFKCKKPNRKNEEREKKVIKTMETEDDGVSKTDKELEITEKSELLYVDRRLPIDHKPPREASKLRKVMVMLSCVMQLFICNGIGYGLSVMYAELVVVFNAKRADAALVQSLNMGLSAGAGILFAGIIKKYGPGGSIVVASVISSIGLFASSFAHGVGAIVLFTGVVTGLAMCVSYLASFVAISLLFYKDPTLFLISMTSGTSLGQFIVPLLFEVFISKYSWSGAFILLSGISLNCLQFGLIIHYSRDFFYKGNDQNNSSSKISAFCDVTLLSDFLMWILWTNGFLLAFTANVEAWFIVDHAVSIGLTRESGSLMVSAIGLGNLIGRMIGSTIRFKCNKLPTVYHWIYLCVLTAGIHVFVINVRDVLPLIIACLTMGVGMGTTAAQAPAIMFEASGLDRYPQCMAMVNVMYGAGEALSALLGGLVKDLLGKYDLVFYVASGLSLYMSVSSSVAAFYMKRRKTSEEMSRSRTDYTSFE